MDLWLLTEWRLIRMLVAVIEFAYAFGTWRGKVNSVLEQLGKSMKVVTTDLKSLTESMNEVKNEQKSLRKPVSKVENDIARIQLHSTTLPLVETNSPLRLTEHGKKYSVDQSVKDWAEGHAMHLVEEAAGNPEFKIFEMCVAYVSDQFGEDSDFNEKIRASAYESGYEVGHLIKVYDVELRDAVLSKLDS